MRIMSLERKAVVALVIHEGKVLVGKKKEGSEGKLSGKWHIPGETLEVEETDECGLVRGIMEEAGIKIKPENYLGTHIAEKGTRVNWYECTPLTVNIVAGSDLEEVRWVSFEDVIQFCSQGALSLWPQAIQEYFQK